MKFSFVKSDRNEVIVYAEEENELVRSIKSLCESENELIGYSDGEIYKFTPRDAVCFLSEGDSLYAMTENGRLKIKSRLCHIEGELPPSFVRISQSCIANIDKMEKFDASFAGTLAVIFTNGYRDYVSRRNLKKVKERLGLKK